MADEEPIVAGRRRSRGAEATARSDALQRLKALRRGGRRSDGVGFQIKVEDPIYDTVDEDEYDKLVAKRREEFRGFIVDDNGSGYGDEGQEEDWSLAGVPPSSDESDGEAERPKKKKTEKKDPPPKKPSPLSAAAAMMGKQRLSSMFTSSVFKKSRDDKVKGLSCDSIVDDVIAEFAPDEADRERRRRGQSGLVSGGRNFVPGTTIKMEISPISIRPEPTKVTIADGDSVSSSMQNGNMVEGKGVVKESKDANDLNCGLGDRRDFLEETKDGKDLNSKMDAESIVQSHDPLTKVDAVEETVPDAVEDKSEQAVKRKEVHSLNAKIKEEKDLTLSAATAGWQAVRNGGNPSAGYEGEVVNPSLNCEEKADFLLDSDGSLPFYILDAHEEFYGANMGNLYLFGKVKAGSAYHSCCVVVKNMERCVYAIPNDSVFGNDEIMRLEKDIEASRVSPAALRTKLQDVASGLKNEIAKQLLNLNVSTFSMTPVKRSYAFERADIPVGENYVLKINYPFKNFGDWEATFFKIPDPPLPADLKGEAFCALLGTHCRKIMGPYWLSISKFSSCPAPERVSWCKFEVTVDCPKDIRILASSSKNIAEIPPVVVTAINLKTIINEKQNVNEIVSASVICCHKVKVESIGEGTPGLSTIGQLIPPCYPQNGRGLVCSAILLLYANLMEAYSQWGSLKRLQIETLRLEQMFYALKSGSERALLNRLMIELYKLDSDVLVGHNISGFDLDVLLHRAEACKVPMWSKIGRLKRRVMPKLTRGSTIFGSGASPGIMSCIAGRLLCDTYLCSRDLLKEVSYSLTQLAKTQLNKDRKEIAPQDVSRMFQTSESLVQLIEYGETDAWLSMELMFHLSVLPLTRLLTNISGNLWGKTLQGARAQRVEYLLLHEFHAKKYIVPDKISSHLRETKWTKRRMNQGGAEDRNIDELDVDDAHVENDAHHNNQGKGKKGPAYSGGLVLEPKRGLYDKYILLLDFNSLYPSIIQEYNICFTTVERSPDGSVPRLPSSKTTGVLPENIIGLMPFMRFPLFWWKVNWEKDGTSVAVERRKTVKSRLKTASGLKVQQLDIQQQALKLTANSMYGCLGFSNSRFYAKPLAELITLQGREILQSTVDLVQNNLNLEVIYGDTDSIMIYTGLDDITKAKAIAGKVIQEVNKKYRCLEIDLDGLYKRMLLLKKKKYAAVKLQFKDGTPYEVIERKGLDMVRRDWSLLSKELGDFSLSQILSGGSCEDVVESIHNSLMKVQEDMRNGEVALEKYIITKSLTKPPEAYPDKNQPHVQVALRLKQSGYSTGCSAGDTVPYIICCEQGTSSGSSTGIAQRARHPDELKRDNGKWMIDIDYYLAQQIHPVVSRLCASIQGTSPARLADCLGLDSSKFQSRRSEAINNDFSISLLSADEERYRGCEHLILSCPSCFGTFDCPTLFNSVHTSITEKSTQVQVEESNNFWQRLRCPKCPEEGDVGRMSPALIANQVKRQADGFISMYYKGSMMCDDETCKHTTNSLNLRVIGDSERGTVCPNYPRCNGRLVRKYTEADLYKQLSYFCHVLDTVRCIEKMEVSTRIPIEKELARIRPLVNLAASTTQKIRDRCAYGWVQLDDLTVTV
ncbi:DNA polymerase alpha catalytic subunit [Vitis vinifera]|uniref:DNA polymerase n=1 Tax=Vitis vinifera TaxID=29760 RepID=A0A438KJ15_VITVI|nr:DNA polymerase alpha catalytic subunit [Vitis vinifera]